MSETQGAALRAIVGRDPALRAVLARTALVAPTSVPVLVTGESGTGKELLARALHELGARPDGPLVTVNCGALPRELAESELFGHERGAFTGASARREGWFEEASGGTLVLDEIGELPLDLQPKLLRVLETGRIRRVGAAGEVAVRVRIVAMTLRDLGRDSRRGAFRLDLYHRLAGFELALPPLRSRRSDIPLLARHFLHEVEPETGPREIDAAALAAIEAHSWPGNVRELRNVVRRAAILTGAVIDLPSLELGDPAPGYPSPPQVDLVRPAALDPPAAPQLRETSETPVAPAPCLDDVLSLPGLTFEQIERAVFAWSLRRNGGSRRRAARALSVSRSTFCDKVKRYHLA